MFYYGTPGHGFHINTPANKHPGTQGWVRTSTLGLSTAIHLISQFCHIHPILEASSFSSYWWKSVTVSQVTTFQKVMLSQELQRNSGINNKTTPDPRPSSSRPQQFLPHSQISPQNQSRTFALQPTRNSFPRKRRKRQRVPCPLSALRCINQIMGDGESPGGGQKLISLHLERKSQEWRKKCSTLPSPFLHICLLTRLLHLPWQVPIYPYLIFVPIYFIYPNLYLIKFKSANTPWERSDTSLRSNSLIKYSSNASSSNRRCIPIIYLAYTLY